MAIMLLLLGYDKVVSNIICTIVSSVTFVSGTVHQKKLSSCSPVYFVSSLLVTRFRLC